MVHQIERREELLERQVAKRTRELENINAELMVARDAAKASSNAKGQFLATMSHEIRTPMNAIIGMSDLMLKADLSPQMNEYATIINTSSKDLLKIINDILDFSKIDAGKLDIEVVPVNLRDLLEEVADFFKNKPKNLKIDYLTFSGSGEPTLHRAIGSLIKRVREIAPLPVVLITNSSSMVDPSVRRALLNADVIIPSLDAVTQDIFKKIDRPLRGLRIKDIISGLLKFRKVFRGSLWLEVMLVRGVNDKIDYLQKIKKVADLIKPDKVQINVPVRTPAEEWVRIPMRSTLRQAKKIFGKNCDIIC